jgi:lantibiotic modifying enzyme
VARDFFTQSGLAAVHDRIQSLSDRDRQRQEQLLVTALSESPASRFESPVPSATGSSGEAPERLGEAAVWIGTELRRLVRTRASAGHDPAPGSCPHLLYDGTIGPALFFAALHAVTNEAGWADDSRGALAPVCASIRHGEIDSWTADGIGAGDGLGSLVYGLTLASAFLNDGSLSDAAMNVASHLAGRVEGDGHFDVMSGAAGAALALLALHDYRRDPILLEWAAACGTHLVERHTRVDDGAAWPDVNGRRIVGFAHGAAGIAFTLQRLFERTAVSSFGDVARLAYRFERRQYLAGQANWPVADVPVGDASGAMPSMMAWCHGGPGIALANASALAGLGEVAAVEVETVLTAAARWIPSRPDHLCCGTLGRSEILLTVGRTLRRPEAVTAAHALAEQVVARARQVGHFRLSAPGFEYRVFDPGFFRGLSGIGYGLLRLAAPDRLPSVLAFEAPGRSRGGA